VTSGSGQMCCLLPLGRRAVVLYEGVRRSLTPVRTLSLCQRVQFHFLRLTLILFSLVAQQPYSSVGLLNVEVSRSHTTTHHTRWESSGRVISPLPDNTQHSQNTTVHAPGGIRTPNPSKRPASDLRLRPRGHQDQPL